MKTTVKLMALLLALLVTVVPILGCNPEDGGTTTTTTSGNNGGGNGDSATANIDYAQNPFRVMAWWDSTPAEGSSGEENWAEVRQKYNISEVKWVSVAIGEYYTSLTTNLASGNPVDIAWINTENFIPFAAQGRLSNLDAYDVTKSDLYINEFSEVMVYNGHRYGVVSDTYAEGLIYNRDMIKTAGLTDPQKLYSEGKWDWETFRQYCIKLTDESKDQYGLTCGNFFSTAGLSLNFIYSNDGIITKEEDGRVVFAMEDPKTMKALQYVYDLANVDRVMNPSKITYFADTTSWQAGKVAFYTESGWSMINNKTLDLAFDFAFVSYPQGPDADGPSTRMYSVTGVTAPVGSYDPIGALTVFEDLVSGNTKDEICTDEITGEYDESLWTDYIQYGKIYWSDKAMKNLVTDEADIPVMRQMIKDQTPVMDAGYGLTLLLQDMMYFIMSNTETPTSAVAAMKGAAQDYIDKATGQVSVSDGTDDSAAG